MRQTKKFLTYIFCINTFFALSGTTIKISQITPNKPIIADNSLTLYLDRDIIIDKKVQLITASKKFNNNPRARITITSQTPHKIIIKKNGIWDLTSFDASNNAIEFTGKANVTLEKGGSILFHGASIKMHEKLQYDINPSQ